MKSIVQHHLNNKFPEYNVIDIIFMEASDSTIKVEFKHNDGKLFSTATESRTEILSVWDLLETVYKSQK